MSYTPPVLTDGLIRRYLGVLGVERRECGLDALNELVSAHLTRIPFENISKIYRFQRFGLRGIPPIETFLDDIEQLHFGGVCFANNVHFYALLTSLGYDTKLCGADMRTPNGHISIIVTMEGREYLIDMGYGAPLSSAIPLDLADDYVIQLPGAEYRLKPRDAAGRSRMEFLQNGAVKGFYVVKPEPMRIEEFAQAIDDAYLPDAPFRNFVLLARFWPGRFRVIHNFIVLDSSTTNFSVKKLANRGDLVRCIEQSFGIPAPIVNETLDGVRTLATA